MGNRAQGIFGSLPILAAAFGRRHGVQVVIGGDLAYTDGKTIHLPAIPLDCEESLEVKAFGFLYHESGHIEFTDMTTYGQASTPFEANILNVIEDVRMESMRNATYPGSAASLSRLAELLGKEGRFGTAEIIANAPPQDVLTMGVLTRLRHRVLEQPLEEAAQGWWPRVEALLGTVGSIKLEALLGQVDRLDTTAESLALARRIKTLVEEEAKPQEPPKAEQPNPSPDASDSDGEGNEGNGSSDDAGGEPGQGDSGQSSQDGSATSDGAADGISGQADHRALTQALGASADSFAPTDLGQVLGESLSKEAKQAVKDDASEHLGTNENSGAVNNPLEVSKSKVSGHGELQKVLGQSQQLRTRLVAAMEARARTKVTHRRQGARIDGNVLHRLFTGDTRVFVRKDIKRKVNTAVQILLDRSGSMSGVQIEVARQAALATAMGVGQIEGCKVAAAAFPSLVVLKEFDETTRGSAGRFQLEATGGTPMGRAMIWAASQLSVRREDRKMLIVVTDGDPDDSAMVQRLARMYSSSGVEVVGVGINSQSVTRLFPASVVISSVDDLAGALFGVIKDKLRRVA